MNLMKFKGADDAVKLTIRLSAGYCIILTIAFASSIIFLINKIEKAYGQALVIDRQGEVYEASSLSASDMRQYEYMNHVKTFVTHWYAFDERQLREEHFACAQPHRQQGEGAVERVQRCEYAELTHTKEYPLRGTHQGCRD